jgi:hypothetical protein
MATAPSNKSQTVPAHIEHLLRELKQLGNQVRRTEHDRSQHSAPMLVIRGK